MRRIYLAILFVAVTALSFALMVGVQRLVSNIAQPDVLPASNPRNAN
jgi:hypothetical protein